MTPPFRPSARLLFSVPAQLAAFALATLIVFWINADALFLRWDGTVHLMETVNQFRWGGDLLTWHLNPLMGAGEPNFVNQYRLLPHMALGYWIGGPEIARPIAAAVAATLYFATALAALRIFGFGAAHATFAGVAMCLLLLPYNVPPPTFIRAWGNMPLLPGIGAALLTAALYWRIGAQGRTWRHDFYDMLAIWALIAWLASALPAVVAMCAPAMVWIGLARVIGAPREERRRCLIAASILVIATLPFLWHVVELHIYSKVAFFGGEIETLQTGLRQISFFVYIHGEGTPLGEAVLWAGAGGAAIIALFRGAAQRRLALAYLGLCAALLAIAAGFDLFAGGWSGPPLAYIDLTIIPLHIAFALAPPALAVAFFADRIGRIERTAATIAQIRATAPIVAIGLVWLTLPLALWRADGPAFRVHGPWPWPQSRTPMVTFLEREIGLLADGEFHGRFVSFAGYRGERNPFNAQHAFENGLIDASGNDHRANGLWYYGIPTLSSSIHLTSPFFEAIANKLLSAPGSEITRAHTSITAYVPRLLAAFGVRYVAAEAPIAGAVPAAAFQAGSTTLYLHEIADANRGDHAARTTERVDDMRTALTRLADPAFDPAHIAIINEIVEGPLVPTREAKMTFLPGRVEFSARANGRALALLPLDFSRCFRFEFESTGATPPRALRANVAQTGVLFENDVRARIRLDFGPFDNVGCRLRDFADARTWRMADVARWRP